MLVSLYSTISDMDFLCSIFRTVFIASKNSSGK